MNDDEKARFNAALDLVQSLDQRIAQQVEHQLGQRLAREREYLRCTVSDLIVAERERSMGGTVFSPSVIVSGKVRVCSRQT